jgi:hypothetical protein
MTGNAPAHGRKSKSASRGPQKCWRSRNISAPCKTCKRYGSPCHVPADEVCFYCPTHCPACNPQPQPTEVTEP